MTQMGVDRDPQLESVLDDLRRAVRTTGLPATSQTLTPHNGQVLVLEHAARTLGELESRSALQMHPLPPRVPRVGRFLASLQETIGRLVGSTWHVYSVVIQQNLANSLIVQVLRDFSRTVAVHEGQLHALEAEHSAVIAESQARLQSTESELARLHDLLNDTQARLADAERTIRELHDELQAAVLPQPATTNAFNYFAFELTFRGSRRLVRERQRVYLDVFPQGGDILDIGCGRGEFLQLMLEQGARPRGIELNPQMVSYCLSEGLPVEHADAISYLQRLEDNSLDGIFCAQVIEHVDLDYLITLLDLCHSKLRSGAPIVLETPNPLCLSIYARSFYADPTHRTPVHPGTLQFLLEQAGFWETEIRACTPVPDSERLRELVHAEATAPEWMRTLNENTRRLNDLLFTCMDYAAIARKLALAPQHLRLCGGSDPAS